MSFATLLIGIYTKCNFRIYYEAVYWVSIGQQQWLVFGGTILSHYEAVIDVIGSVEGNDTFIQ